MKHKQGFSLVELAIGLAVITILILAISVSAGIRDNARVQSAANSIQSLRAAAENYLSNGNLNYSGMSIDVLKDANLLPASFNAANANPWGGGFSIIPNASDATRFDIVLTSLNQPQADKLTNYFNNSAAAASYDSASTSWSVTF